MERCKWFRGIFATLKKKRDEPKSPSRFSVEVLPDRPGGLAQAAGISIAGIGPLPSWTCAPKIWLISSSENRWA